MNSLKELIKSINEQIQNSDFKYDDILGDSEYLEDILWIMALEKMPNYVQKDQLEQFFDETEKSFKESTFKKFIPNYEEFLRELESDFWASVMLGDVDME